MAEIRPFRGVRFDGRYAGPVGPLLSPPYDAASLNGNVPEFSISAIENADLGAVGDPHQLAHQRYQAWLASGVLAPDPYPAVYLHRHRFASHGSPATRTGLLARVRLRDWDDRVILPHEATNPGPRLERLDRLRTVRANLSPLYFLYRDPTAEVQDLLATLFHQETLPENHDRTGGIHQFLPLSDHLIHHRLGEFFAGRTLFVADGHHRYEAALAFRDEMRQRHPGVEGPWEYVLALLSAVEDPGVVVRPTHRILVGGEPMSASSLLGLLGRWFAVSPSPRPDAIFRIALPGVDAMYAVSPRPGSPHLALLPRERGVAWRGLGITAVEGFLESLLGAGPAARERRVLPVVDEGQALREVGEGVARAAFLLPEPKLDRLLAVAEEGDLLPPKSTWFEPKAPAGLVINDFALSAPVG